MWIVTILHLCFCLPESLLHLMCWTLLRRPRNLSLNGPSGSYTVMVHHIYLQGNTNQTAKIGPVAIAQLCPLKTPGKPSHATHLHVYLNRSPRTRGRALSKTQRQHKKRIVSTQPYLHKHSPRPSAKLSQDRQTSLEDALRHQRQPQLRSILRWARLKAWTVFKNQLRPGMQANTFLPRKGKGQALTTRHR